MVCYCCVKGCKNNNRIKRKDHNSKITFHALPSKPDLKAKWLKAIGRPNWEPPLHMRLCSIHFDNNQIKREGYRTRIKDDACPTRFLPVNSNFEANGLQVCRICLATDIKMYSLQEGVLKSCIEDIHGLIENINIDGMPQFVCYECGACLIKFYQLLEKSVIAQATLLDIFANNGKLSMNLIKQQDRRKLNLNSSLTRYKSTHIYKYTYDEGDDTFLTIKSDYSDDIDNNDDEYLKYDDKEHEVDTERTSVPWEGTVKIDVIDQTENVHEEITCNNNDEDPTAIKENNTVANEIKYTSRDNDVSDDFESYVVIEVKSEKQISGPNKLDKISNKKKKKKSKIKNRLTRCEVNMEEHFDIVKLPLQEQIEQWKRTRETITLTSETVYKCEICLKMFAHMTSYRNHIAGHDPSRGKEECPVCKLRFKNKLHVQSHRRHMHGNKFYCKRCPKVFNTMSVARKHYLWHMGHRYKCSWCAFTSAHESAVGTHVRSSHAHVPGAYTCARCGLACRSERGLALHRSIAHKDQPELKVSGEYKCEVCDLYFASEGARRVHILTSRHDRKSSSDSTSLDSCMINSCDKCNMGFTTPVELKIHIEREHQNGIELKTTWRKQADPRPSLCEHCGETMNSRKEHYLHILRQHPKEKHLYQPVITAVCDVCGKGFQNSTKLHLHELRHGQPTVKCDCCPRLFYDKYAAAVHRTVHETAKPYSCRTCGRTFKLKGNLQRHSRVHSSVAPYECPMCEKKFKYSYSVNLHVRTVHYKMPYPSQKKRKIKRNGSNSPVNTT